MLETGLFIQNKLIFTLKSNLFDKFLYKKTNIKESQFFLLFFYFFNQKERKIYEKLHKYFLGESQC
jgi:hypothetical protein